ncbi:PAS domain-containing protein [Persicobacter sp. CCB-QB2]|uniref:PAS domain-containing protein n=1 Tax=Persicobacter sp. CCB-QB2 TaxID=1561025 RepID=UPI0012FB7565|nr:PAS domain-containing protein [Persicobacter sp. CCB-QB2]
MKSLSQIKNQLFKRIFKKELQQYSEMIVEQKKRRDNALNIIDEFSQGNLKVKLEDSTLGDEIHGALIKLKDHFTEKEKIEDQRNWTNIGLAKFADILRMANSETNIADIVLKEVIHYLKANQGMIYTVAKEENETCLVLEACYAYDRKKYLHKKIAIGEGLAGQAYLEMAPIYMTDIPNGYPKITSGLGDATARNIYIIPLMVNEEVYGVMELASFQMFEAFELEFLNKLSEQLAASISSFNLNQKTALLLEESQLQTEQLRAQEEEMRQNTEELMATQEEMKKRQSELELLKTNLESEVFKRTEEIQEQKEELEQQLEEINTTQESLHKQKAEMEGVLLAIDYANYLAEFATDGKITYVNDQFLTLFGKAFTKESLIGKNHREFDELAKQPEAYQQFWDRLRKGEAIKKEGVVQVGERTFYLEENYTPVKNKEGEVVKILNLAHDITKVKELSLQNAAKEREIKDVLNTMNKAIIAATFDYDGNYLEVSSEFCRFFNDPEGYYDGKRDRDFNPLASRPDQYEKFWKHLQSGKSYEYMQNCEINNKKYLIETIYSPIFTPDKQVEKIMLILKPFDLAKINSSVNA